MKHTIITKNCSDYCIVIPASYAPVERTASLELQQYFKKVFGITVTVVLEGAETGKCIYIGHTNYAKKAGIVGKTTENWIIKMHGGNLVLTGGVKENDRGIIYAVYHFLEDIVGVRWWSEWEEYIPEAFELSLEEDFFKEGTPAFAHRKILGFRKYTDFYFEARTRDNVVGDDGLDGLSYNASVKDVGGALQLIGGPHHVHTLNRYIPADKYFEKHPEWFSWSGVEGKRVSYNHYCLTNEDLCDEVTKGMIEYIERDKELEKKTGVPIPDFYDISFPDAIGGFCQCEKCQALIEKSGSTGYALRFVNKMARRIYEIYPDVQLETLAYPPYMELPKDDTIPEKNVTLRLANLYVDIMHDTKNRGNSHYLELIKGWSELCKKSGSRFYIWEYMFNLFMDMPIPMPKRLCESFRTFHENGATGIFVENERTSTDMWELMEYMMLHLAEDPYIDEETLLSDFMPKFYGPAGKYVREYLEELYRCGLENNFSVFCNAESTHFNYLDAKTVNKCMEILDKALDAVKGNETFTFRVQYLKAVLGGNLLVKFYDLKKIAARQGVPFTYDAEEIRKMVVDGFKAAQKNPRFKGTRIDQELVYFENMFLDYEETAPLPAELSNVNPEEVYQFFFKNTCRHALDMVDYGVTFVEDADSSLGVVEKIQSTDKSDALQMSATIMTSRETPFGGGVKIRIQQNGEYKTGIELFKEDVVPDKYHLYKIGSIDNIQKYGDTRVDIFGNNFDWLSLSGISVAFPMDACDVYLSMKFTGEMYGGAKGEKEAIYLDRAIVVRRG